MLIEYSREHVEALLSSLEEASSEERMDLSRAVNTLPLSDRRFLYYFLIGYDLHEAGRKIGKPNNPIRRFHRICRDVSMFLN